MKRDNIRIRVQFVKPGVAYTIGRGKIRVPVAVICDYLHSESVKDLYHDASNLSSADYPGSPAVEVESKESVYRKVIITGTVVGPVNLSVKREDQRGGMLGNSIGRIGRNSHYMYSAVYGLEINIIIARRAEDYQADAAVIQGISNLAADHIIYKKADYLEARCKLRGLLVQPGLEECELMAGGII